MYAQVKGCIVVDLFPQLAEHVTVVIYGEKTAFAKNFLLMNISLGDGFQTQDEQSAVRRECSWEIQSHFIEENVFAGFGFGDAPLPPARKLREHHKGWPFSGILKFSIHASKQFRGRKSFLVVQSWTGKIEASVKI